MVIKMYVITFLDPFRRQGRPCHAAEGKSGALAWLRSRLEEMGNFGRPSGYLLLFGYGSTLLILQIDGFQLDITIPVGHLVP